MKAVVVFDCEYYTLKLIHDLSLYEVTCKPLLLSCAQGLTEISGTHFIST